MHTGIIKHQRVRMHANAAAETNKTAGAAPREASKRVELVMHEGQARAIEFTCTCGEVTLVELAIDASAPAPVARAQRKTEPDASSDASLDTSPDTSPDARKVRS